MDPSQIYSQVCYFYFQHQYQLNIRHGRATNWFSCLATIKINKESTSIWNSDSITMTQPYGSVPRGIYDLLRMSQPTHQRHYSFNMSPNTSKRSAKKKKKLTHRGERRIWLYRACTKNRFNIMSPLSASNLLQQHPRSLVKKVPSSSPTTLLSQNWYRWSRGHGRQYIAYLH